MPSPMTSRMRLTPRQWHPAIGLVLLLATACGDAADPDDASPRPTTTVSGRCEVEHQVRGPGRPLSAFPYTINEEFPHFPHVYPPIPEGSDVDPEGGVTIPVPDEPVQDAVYGAWWPIPPGPDDALLLGVRFEGVSWVGDTADVVIATTVHSERRDNTALGTVIGSGPEGAVVGGIPGELIGAHFERHHDSELRLADPASDVEDGDFALTFDVENAPLLNQGGEVWPSEVSFTDAVVIWEVPRDNASATSPCTT